MTSAIPAQATTLKQFRGFQPLSANFIYTPNQFLDLCLPNCHLNTVRLVGYMLRRTLGWLDNEGNPIEELISIPYRELQCEAGMSRGLIGKSIEEALDLGFISHTRLGMRKQQGRAAVNNEFVLKWDERGNYHTDLNLFDGFFIGEGHRTPVPDDFFHVVLPREPLSTTKVVGAVARHTVGYVNQFGPGRKMVASLPLSYIQKYANIKDVRSAFEAVSRSEKRGYIVCVERGQFSHRPNERKASSYALHWLTEAATSANGSENPTSDQSQKPNSVSVHDSQQKRYRIPNSISSRNPAEDQFRKPSSRKTQKKNTPKQQQKEGVAAEIIEVFQLLTNAGFDEQIATRLSALRPHDEIAQQIAWIDFRNPRENRLGMLRRAIEEAWAEPEGAKTQQEHRMQRERVGEWERQQAAKQQAADDEKRQRQKQRAVWLQQWRNLSLAEQSSHHRRAIEQAPSEAARRRLRHHKDLNNPPTETLETMAHATAALSI